MSVHMTEAEAWDFVTTAHTGVITTLRADGFPVSVPVWFIADDQSVLIAGPAKSLKFARAARDSRVSFLAESGERWAELKAVRFDGQAELLGEPDWARFDERFEAKYGAYRTARTDMPESARRAYNAARSLMRVTPVRSLTSWDNEKLRS